MTTSPHELKLEFRNRLSMFQEGYTFEECDGLVRPFTLLGELLTAALDPVAAERGMRALRCVISTRPDQDLDLTKMAAVDAVHDWADQWDELDAFNDTYWSDAMERAHNLHAFAYYGILPTWDLPDVAPDMTEIADVPLYIRQTIDRLTRFTALLPKAREYYGVESIERTCLAATARLKLDDRDPVTVHELAALTGVTSKRLQNAIYAKSEDAPIPGKSGLIPTEGAQRWLHAREYLPSLWQEFIEARCWEVDLTDNPVLRRAGESSAPEEFLFVPEAKDGTIFSPQGCLRPGKTSEKPHYTIGPKGEEQNFESYEDALEVLVAMPTPRWRRPNENGLFGIVTTERWRRLSRSELQAH